MGQGRARLEARLHLCSKAVLERRRGKSSTGLASADLSFLSRHLLPLFLSMQSGCLAASLRVETPIFGKFSANPTKPTLPELPAVICAVNNTGLRPDTAKPPAAPICPFLAPSWRNELGSHCVSPSYGDGHQEPGVHTSSYCPTVAVPARGN